MKKEYIISFYIKIESSLEFFDRLNKSSLDIDNSTISWKSGKKVFNIKEINLDDAIKKIYFWMLLNGYQLTPSKRVENTWICSSKKNSYTLQLLDSQETSYSCTCPRYTYKQEICKHILMLEGKRTLDKSKSELNDVS